MVLHKRRIQKGLHLAALFVEQRKNAQFENAEIPVIARPRISACTSCVPS
jgi:hypothetical protein